VVATIVLCSSVDVKQGCTTECRLIPCVGACVNNKLLKVVLIDHDVYPVQYQLHLQ